MPDRLRFFLINPTAPEWRVTDGRAPSRANKTFRFSMLPSLCVAAAMPPNVQTRIIDEDVEPIDFDADADLIGISFMTFNAPRAYQIADRFRAQGKPVIFGGFHPTFLPDEAKEHADAVCIGEAEPNVPAMIADFTAGRLQPFYDLGPADLKGLRIPDRSLIRKSAYITPYAIQATRGCRYRCKFCSVAAFHRYRYRTRPIDEVLAELRVLGRNVLFIDDNLVADRDYAKALFAKMVPLRKCWAGQGSIDMAADEELLRLARASGCRGMFVGLESVSQENLRQSNKYFCRARDYVRAIARFHAAGIGIYAGIVLGMDHDTPAAFPATLDFLDEARIDAVQVTVLTPFPGTPLFDELDRQGRIFDKDWSKYDFNHVVFEPQNMSPQTLQAGHDWVCRKFYSLGPTLQRLWRTMRFLGPASTLATAVPLNLGYRRRFRANGVPYREAEGVPVTCSSGTPS
jgi:radical SAM superfamily enzyme YgiQ (UPF0313 family)